ncbi:hypothetical protein FJO69_02980, partial [[Mycoplasma] falconis]
NPVYVYKSGTKWFEEKNGIKTDITDQIPFEIPKSWIWIKTNQVCKIETGTRDADFASEIGKFNFFTCSKNISKCNDYKYNGKYLILAGNGANIGNCIYFEGKFHAYQRTYLISEILEKEYFLKYLSFVMNALWKDWNKEKLFGSAIPYIKLNNIESFLIPLPPLEEQQRIVAKLEKIWPLLDKYATLYNKLTDLESKFPHSLKKSILNYAISGKLTKQLPSDSSVEDLLALIKKEKEKLIAEKKIKANKT